MAHSPTHSPIPSPTYPTQSAQRGRQPPPNYTRSNLNDPSKISPNQPHLQYRGGNYYNDIPNANNGNRARSVSPNPSPRKSKVYDSDDDVSNETFVVYGTELPDISSEQDNGKFVPVWKQEVRDENGIRRLHGAFKGGWSAGYYNTVGSKEGWSPSSFVSSRKKRTDFKAYKPEDFMDEEDLEELAQEKKLVTTEEFDYFGSTERELEKKNAMRKSMEAGGSVLGTLTDKFIADLIEPSKDPIGILNFLKNEVAIYIYPCIVNLLNQLEYLGGIGFGVSDDEEDEIYINGETSMSNFHTSMMDDYEDILILGGKEHSKSTPKSKPNTNSYKSAAPNKSVCHDGSLPLPGFVLASRPIPLDEWYSPPTLPPDFVSIHKFDSSTEKVLNPVGSKTQNSKNQKQSTLALIAEQRGELLGETPLKAPARSVFDYISRKDKEKLDNIISYRFDTVGESPKDQNNKVQIPKIGKDIAMAALKGFIPFSDNKNKQMRYKQFLEAQAEIISDELIRQPEGMTSEEYAKELDEFSQATRIFRPMSSMLASRFTSSSNSSLEISNDDNNRSVEKIIEDGSYLKRQEDNRKQTQSTAETAARMNMFGTLTRSKTEFYPNRLLCKRFNIANPHPDHKK
ncbi:8130_t:CDS:10 [Entrophospora sp. SA101]|nr:5734_t:CDS:10 [Entrophospora sp. SA101]CAJ0753355.1 16007_t:CDS:10 [Entrophospora sp. SA101]CAJ0756441.1 8130_t:CDS:10 [Entrophospora sp. SA101]CAJ0846224.1 17499_t:CDS:10 [Entrophospora sp. SA101]CAJ0898012.1 14006_t:CDS:10 [Entrophospora sp. SA101]